MVRKNMMMSLVVALGVAACSASDSTDQSAAATGNSEASTNEEEFVPLEEPSAAAGSETATTSSMPDPIRGSGGLEEKCQARVAQETGATVNGTNRIEESEAAVEIYVNVDGATAPWKCLGYRDGSIAEVSFTGSEGAL